VIHFPRESVKVTGNQRKGKKPAEFKYVRSPKQDRNYSRVDETVNESEVKCAVLFTRARDPGTELKTNQFKKQAPYKTGAQKTTFMVAVYEAYNDCHSTQQQMRPRVLELRAE
jgi:hypothetical protein